MGQYKVPQNVEAEDKIIGPLTLKQFIYAVIGIAYGGITFMMMKEFIVLWLIIGLPPAGLFLLLGLYQRNDQPFEVYLVALVQYWFRPRTKVWHKDPLIEVFHIEQPKMIVEEKRRDPNDVYSELEKLSQVVDTRGWGSKEASIQEPSANLYMPSEDRIIAPSIPESATNRMAADLDVEDDILDFKNSPSAQNLEKLISDSTQQMREEALHRMEKAEKLKPKVHENKSTSGMTENPFADILKSSMETETLTVSQLAAQATRTAALSEGEAVNLRDVTKSN